MMFLRTCCKQRGLLRTLVVETLSSIVDTDFSIQDEEVETAAKALQSSEFHTTHSPTHVSGRLPRMFTSLSVLSILFMTLLLTQ